MSYDTFLIPGVTDSLLYYHLIPNVPIESCTTHVGAYNSIHISFGTAGEQVVACVQSGYQRFEIDAAEPSWDEIFVQVYPIFGHQVKIHPDPIDLST